MATTTTNINKKTLPVGPTVVGPFTAVNGLLQVQFQINRVITGSSADLDSLTSASTLALEIQQSPDGTQPFVDCAGETIQGGHEVNKFTQATVTVDQITLTINPPLPAGTQVQLLTTVGGPSSIEVSGLVAVTT